MTELAVTAVSIRRPLPRDRVGIEQMWGRCSAETRFQRLHSPCAALPRSYLDNVISDPDGSRIAERVGAEIVGLASLVLTANGVADLGVIVEDRWQRQRIGTQLARELLAGASARQIHLIKAEVLASSAHLLRPLRQIPGQFHLTSYGRTTEATIQILRRTSGTPALAEPTMDSTLPTKSVTNTELSLT